MGRVIGTRPKRVSRVWIARKKPTKITRKTVAKIAKKVVMANEETKHKTTAVTFSTYKHDTVYTTQLLTDITQGTTNSTRIGDNINLSGFKFKMASYSDYTTAKPCTYRFMVVRVKKDTTPTEAQLFDSSSPATWCIMRHTKPQYCKVLLDKLIYPRIPTSGSAPVVQVNEFYVPIKAKHLFDGSGSTTGKYYNYWIVITPFVVGGQLGTTDALQHLLEYKTYFKDA